MSRPRILVVDDDEQVCFVASRALESIGRCDAVHTVAILADMLDFSNAIYDPELRLLSQAANSTASLTCLLPLTTAVDEPPQLPAIFEPAVHCGR